MLLTMTMAMTLATLLSCVVAWVALQWDAAEVELTEGLKTTISTITGFFMFASAFLAVNALDNLSDARNALYAEAGALREAYWAAGELPEQEKTEVRKQLRDYAQLVISDEWPKMNPQGVSKISWAPLDGVRESLLAAQKKQGNDSSTARRQMDMRIHELYDARRMRLAEATRGLPQPMVVVMVALGALTLLLASFTARPASKVQWLLLAIGAAVFGSIINLIIELDYPYSGHIQIDPSSYERALRRFREIGL
ncbi:bestrophin-like domain [Streptomyces vinaceus]|uniref:bestrophin-like domain n=1 Tax=Streptomyces vinaceus TaxID=1960 RepID=UPI00382E2C0A